jgi:hypothetical protein
VVVGADTVNVLVFAARLLLLIVKVAVPLLIEAADNAPVLSVTPPIVLEPVLAVMVVIPDNAPLLSVTPPIWFDPVEVVVTFPVTFNVEPLNVKLALALTVPELVPEVISELQVT